MPNKIFFVYITYLSVLNEELRRVCSEYNIKTAFKFGGLLDR